MHVARASPGLSSRSICLTVTNYTFQILHFLCYAAQLYHTNVRYVMLLQLNTIYEKPTEFDQSQQFESNAIRHT